jgi:hypothetical protein
MVLCDLLMCSVRDFVDKQMAKVVVTIMRSIVAETQVVFCY